MNTRRGFTLAELLVGMVILGIIGVALSTLILSQSRFYDNQAQRRRARFVSRAAVNAALSDLRMVEATSGIVSATPTQVVVRVPYAMGIACGHAAGPETLALFPVDSTLYANAGFSGFAWRDSLGNYTYVEAGAAIGVGAAGTCTAAGVTPLPTSNVVTVTPVGFPAAYPVLTEVGSPVLLFQRMTYEFKASSTMPGRTALWRTIVATGQTDELVAPFDTSAKFRFFVVGSDTAQSAVPVPAISIRGLELDFNSQSEHAPEGSGAVNTSQVVTAVFFNNRAK
jgi:prepilin-type N-terminal cleavage/methylation domain-containing protein